MFRILAAGFLAAAGLPLAAAASTAYTYTDAPWCDDAVPAGAQQLTGAAGEGWTWVAASPAPYSGKLSHQSMLAAGLHDHSFNYASTPLALGPNDELFTYVYLNPSNPPTEIMLSWNDGSSWEHRAYWGADQIDYGSDGTVGRVSMGALPATGQWVRLTVPAAQVGLGGLSAVGMGFSTYGGQATYDYSGDSVAAPVPAYTDVPWCDDAVPAGAQQLTGAAGEGWTWVAASPAPYSGKLSHQSMLAAGLHDHSFNYASTPLAIGPNDELFTYVYLNPSNPPTEIMLSWNDGSSWEHRAFWGADQIDYGSDGTVGRVNMGALPASGQWVRLTVPAAQVGLGGLSVVGMGFSTYGGQAAYDYSGDSVANATAGGGSIGGSAGSGGQSGTGSTPSAPAGLGAVGVIAGSFGADTANRTADVTQPAGDYVEDTALQLPQVGDCELHILSPTVLELVSINSKAPDPAQVTSWNFVKSNGAAAEPAAGEFAVTVNGTAATVTGVGFRRRVLYAPLNTYDLRIENDLYLTLAAPIAAAQAVAVTNPDGTLWTTAQKFAGTFSPTRNSRAIHVNQEGYAPEFAKRAVVGYYLGDLGELPLAAGTAFNLINAATGATVYSGTLAASADSGYQTTPLPYQQVYVADFSAYTTPGQYEIQVAGLGVSLPFLIDDGIAMAWARTYALGLYEQRSGMAVALPFTRFTHAADHTAPAAIPVPDSAPQYSFTWNCVGGYAATVNTANPPQVGPFLTSNETSLYPFVNTGTVNVSGGHFDAGDYSKYTINSAQLIHELIFATDNIPGCGGFDNLAIPESGDGVPDALQEAKWEADFLVKMQDADGGFYFLVYPLDREYESNVLPENGDPQVVWPKNTSATAAAVAALAEAGSSPAMKRFYPQAAAQYLQAAATGWNFLMSAIAKYGLAGSYQKITFYGDDWTHDDELAWAAAAMYAATGNAAYQTQLFAWFPNPADPSTFRWGWQQMAECWGNAVRTYAFAARSGRLPASALNASYLAACDAQIVAAGDNAVAWGQACAYGTPFPPETKAVLGGGWYFSLDQASDMAVAYQVDPKPAYVDGLVAAMDYEGGTNPVNVCYLEGLGVKRQQQVVSQYAQNSRRLFAPSGFVAGQVTAAYEYLNQYGSELSELSYPTDSGSTNTYPFYDRWADAYNVTTEQITVNLARSFMATGFLASLTHSSATPWTGTAATITVPSGTPALDKAMTLTVQVAGQSLTNARIVWEGRDQEPALGASFAYIPVNNGSQWAEVEVEWPDGRRAFGATTFTANSTNQVWIDDALPGGATTASDGGDSWNWISANPAPHSGRLAFQSSIQTGEHDVSFGGASDQSDSAVGAVGPMLVSTGDTLYAWVYINPSNPPTELMLCWYDGSSYEHRAYWGANQITWGNNNSAGRYYAGALPAAGKWVELTVPASAVGLPGLTVSGMTFAAQGGQVTWDTIGRSNPNTP